MNDAQFEALLQGALEVATDEEEFPVDRIATFAEVGALTHNQGLVVTMNDGSVFELTIVQAR